MKFVCWGDLHSHNFSEFAEKDTITGNSRLTWILNALDYMKDYCLDNNIEYILGAGDIFHKRAAVDTKVYNFTYNKIKEISDSGIKLVTIVGNHDQYSNESFPEHSLEAFKEIDNVTVLDRFTPLQISDDVVIYPASYSKDVQMIKDKITEYTEGIESGEHTEHSILLGHFGIDGASVGKSSYSLQGAFKMGDLYPEVFDFGIFGHYHSPQLLGGNSHYCYTGSPLPHNFNDVGDFGFVLIDTETGELEFKTIPTPKFITVTDPDTDLTSLVGNYVRFQIPAEKVESLQEEMPEELKHRIEPQKEYTDEKRVDISHSMSDSEIVKAYCNKYNSDAVDVMLEILREVE